MLNFPVAATDSDDCNRRRRTPTQPPRDLHLPLRGSDHCNSPIWKNQNPNPRLHLPLRDSDHCNHYIAQANLAEQLGVSGAFINNIEAGRKGPSLALVLHIAEYFGVSTDYLLQDSIPINSATPSSSLPSRRVSDSPSPPQLFGQKLRYLRKNRGMTPMSLVAELCLRSQSHISLMESGQNEPSIEMVIQLASLFGVTTDYLLQDTISTEIGNIQTDHEAR